MEDLQGRIMIKVVKENDLYPPTIVYVKRQNTLLLQAMGKLSKFQANKLIPQTN